MSQNATSGFAAFVPGFEFLQNLAQQGQGLGAAAGALPQLNHWVAPTFSVEELDKRIQELKAVHFWLDQNGKALAATIQALEVQKMTLATLKTMNLNLGDVADALKVDPAAFAANSSPKTGKSTFAGLEVPERTYGKAPAAAPKPKTAPKKTKTPPAGAGKADGAAAPPGVDPVQWWGALTEQFQAIASQALKDVSAAAPAPVAKRAARQTAKAPAKSAPAAKSATARRRT